jgi:Zn-dependent M28 family amino/carboxypeptidase
MDEALEKRLEAHVRHLSQTIGERHFRRPDALAAACDYIRSQLRPVGVEWKEQPFHVQGQSFVNIEAVVRGAQETTQEPGCVVVGAHYDTVEGTPGADDNASAVAALLELVAAQKDPPRRTLRFVFFANEEPPFFPDSGMGSAAYASSLRQKEIDVHVMISLEMLGYYCDKPHSQRYPPGLSPFYGDRGNFIGFVSNLRSRKRMHEVKRAFLASSRFPCESLAAPQWTVIVGLSDHRSFWKQGYPALMVTDTAFMRNPHYHRSTDTADTLDYTRFAQVTEGMIGAVRRLGQ